jgi:predicted hydrocarbon binding protein
MVFVELKKYVETRLGHDAWKAMLSEAGQKNQMFTSTRVYDDSHALAMVVAASKIAGLSTDEVLEDFGQFMLPDLMQWFRALTRPEWTFLDFVENLERTIHRVVRIKESSSTPPSLICQRLGRNEAKITYCSPRKMCAFARGLLQGLAVHYGEAVRIIEPACMLRGAPSCEIRVSVADAVA